MEEEIDLMDMIKYFWKKKIWIILIGFICIVLAIVYTKYLIKPEYTATATFILTNDNLETEADVYSYAKLPDRYYVVANSKTVLEKVIQNLKLNIDVSNLSGNIEITHSPVNFLIKVKVNYNSAKTAADIANEIVRISIEEIKRIYNDENVQVLDAAVEDWKPININYIENIIIFSVIGEIVVCGCILLKYVFCENYNKKEVEDANKE